MKQTQGFIFQRFNKLRQVWENKGHLLLPADVIEFNRLITEMNYPYIKAFERLTGIDDSFELANIRLVVQYIDETSMERVEHA